MHWIFIVLIIIVYLMIGGAVTSIVERVCPKYLGDYEIMDFLEDIPPLIYIVFWPIFVFFGLLGAIVICAAGFGGALMDYLLDLNNKNDKENTSK